MVPKFALVLALGAISLVARGDEVFRWVDENGKTHYGSAVPEKYKQQSKKIDAAGREVTGAQRDDAATRSAQDKARAESLRKAREAKAASVSSKPAEEDAKPAAQPPVAVQGSDCQEQMRKYQESLDCFAPYTLANGATKPEAFEKCQTVTQPKGCLPPSGSSERTY